MPGARSILACVSLALAASCSRGASQAHPPPAPLGRATEQAGPVAPEAGQCRGPVSRMIISSATDVRPPVPCDQPHGSETVFVGEVTPEVADLPYAQANALTDGSPALRPLLDRCDEEFADYVGVSRIGPDAVRETNLGRAFFIPPAEDWERGARWFRCDAVTVPPNAQTARATTERLRGVLSQDPLGARWRSCFSDVAPPPAMRFDGFTTCDLPHGGEALLRFREADPKVDALVADQGALEEYARTGFAPACLERIAARIGLSVEALSQRPDIRTFANPLQVSRWAADPAARWVQCLASTSGPTVGTLEGLGASPVPLP